MRRPDCCNRPETAAGWANAFNKRLFCRKCRRCLQHDGCACRKCPMCYKNMEPKALCPRCHRCKTHHQERIFRIGEVPFRPCVVEPEAPNTYLLNPLRRSLGLEVELEQFHGLSQANCNHIRFHIEHDGSVAGSGRELVTEKLSGDRFITGISDLSSAIKTLGSVAGETAGFHVHVDAIDYNALDLRRMFVLFALIQDQLFGTLVSEVRRYNQFCPPLRGSKSELRHLIQLTKPNQINKFFYRYLYGVDTPDTSAMTAAEVRSTTASIMRNINGFKSKKYMNAARRQALNFHSWMMRGTLEFRLHEGTTNPKSLLMWPLWCGWLVQKTISSELSDKEIAYWVDKGPPSIVQLSERFAEGKIAMPKNILDWVKSRCR